MDWKNLDYGEVAGMQIIKALNENINRLFVEGELYKLQQTVANEARERGLLTNPNPAGPTGYGDTGVMVPSATGWEQTKGIQRRVLNRAALNPLRMNEITQPGNCVDRLARKCR